MRSIGILLLLLLVTAAVSLGQPSVNTTETEDFTVTAQPGTWCGRPALEGYVYNKRTMRASRVRLRVDTLDAAGAVTSSEVRPLDRDINSSERAFFQFPQPTAAPAYRVTVDYVFWRHGGPSP
jgi:hypothetical protein